MEAQKAIQGIENVGYGRGFYLMRNGIKWSDKYQVYVENNPRTSETGRAEDRIELKISDEYFTKYYVLEMTYDKFKNQMI